MSRMMRVREHPGSTVRTTAFFSAGAALVALAITAPNFPPTKVESNDGGVWVTKSSSQQVTRFIKQVDAQQQATPTGTGNFEIYQRAGDVLLYDQTNGSVKQIDPAEASIDGQSTVPASAKVAMGGSAASVAILDPTKGDVWSLPFGQAPSFKAADVPPAANVGTKGGDVAVAGDGTVWAASSERHALVEVAPDGAVSEASLPAEWTGAILTTTTVGAEPVVLNDSARAMRLPGGEVVDVSAVGTGLRLQQAGDAATSVLIAGSAGLFEVDLGGGAPRQVGAPIQGQLSGAATFPAPLRVKSCAYGVFPRALDIVQVRVCDGQESPAPQQLLGSRDDGREKIAVPPGDMPDPRLRVNRGLVVINDQVNGQVFDADADVLNRLDRWEAPQQKDELEDQEQNDTVTEQENCNDAASNVAPKAEPDQFGARPGQPAVLDVLKNDTDGDCDVLALKELPLIDPSLGTLSLVAGGRKLQYTPAPAAAGIVTIPYTATDGFPGGDARAVATVTVTPGDGNQPPRSAGKTPRTVVEQSKSVNYNILGDFIDPDGDPLQLTNAVVERGQGTARFLPDGTITYVDASRAPGIVNVKVTITDGRAEVPGNLSVQVKPRGDIPPTARDDYAVGKVGTTVEVLPLVNDSDPNGDPLTIASVQAAGSSSGLDIAWNGTTGRVSLRATRPGIYLLSYDLVAGQSSSKGRIRFDVRPDSPNQPPSAMVDVAGARLSSASDVDVLANDLDPDGDVLAVTGAQATDPTIIQVGVDKQRIVQVRALRNFAGTQRVTYRVSDGTSTATGVVVLRQLPNTLTGQPPIANLDRASVRPGGAITIPVLANDISPDGGTLALARQLSTKANRGEAVVSGNEIRYRAGNEPGKTDRFAYQVVDEFGGRNSGEVVVSITDATDNTAPQPPVVEARVVQGGTVKVEIPLAGVDPDGDMAQITEEPRPSPSFQNPVSLESGEATLKYEAKGSRLGTDTITYTLCDVVPDSKCSTGRVRVAVLKRESNRPPVAVTDDLVVQPGRTVGIAVLENDSDPDGDVLRLVEGSIAADPELSAQQSGQSVVIKSPGREGAYKATYGVSDTYQTAKGTIRVTVSKSAAAQAPIAKDDYVAAKDLITKQYVDVDVLRNDSDPDGTSAALTIEVAAGQSGASVVDGKLRIALTDQPQVIVYNAVDADGLKGMAYVAVPAGDNLVPRLIQPTPKLQAKPGETLAIPLASVVVDPDSGPKPLTIASPNASAQPASQVPVVKGPQELQYQPPDTEETQASVTVLVEDGKATTSVTIPIEIIVGNRAPVVQSLTIEATEAQETKADLKSAATDPDSPADDSGLTFEGGQLEGAAGIQAALAKDGQLTVKAEGATVGRTAALTYIVKDSQGKPSLPAKVTIVVVKTTLDPPQAPPITVERLDQGKSTDVDVVSNAFDPFDGTDQPGLTVEPNATSNTTRVQARVDGDLVVISADQGFSGPATIEYSVKDAAQRQADGVINVFVWGRPNQPGAPRQLPGSLDASSVRLTWEPSSANSFVRDPDAKALTYEVRAGGEKWSCPSNTCTIGSTTGRELQEGSSYNFTVVAINDVGESDPSASLDGVIPDIAPEAATFTPCEDKATCFDAEWVELAWTQEANEGTDVARYELSASPLPAGWSGPLKLAGTVLDQRVTGLKKGTAYKFTLIGFNGKNEKSDPATTERTPFGAPSAPLDVTVSQTDNVLGRELAVDWTDVADNGGDTLLVYEVEAIDTSNNTVAASHAGGVGDSPSYRFQSLDNGKTYRARVTAINRKSQASALSSNSVTVFSLPGAVSSVKASSTGISNTLDLQFTPLTTIEAGGITPDKYEWAVRGGSQWTDLNLATKRISDASQLPEGSAVQIVVRAVNPKGAGPASPPSNGAQAYGPIDVAAAAARAGSNEWDPLVLSWSSDGNGRPLTVTVSGSVNSSSGSGSQTFGGVGNYSITVQACVSGTSECKTAPPAAGRVVPKPTVVIAEWSGAGCSSVYGKCWRVEVYNFAPNSSFSGKLTNDRNNWNGFSGNFSGTTNGSGNGAVNTSYFYGFAGWVEATANGISSGRLGTTNR